MTIAIPAGEVDTVLSFPDGYHTQFVFPTCRAMLWTSLNFTCTLYDNGAFWRRSDNSVFDWNATCGTNTNADRPGMSFGVLP